MVNDAENIEKSQISSLKDRIYYMDNLRVYLTVLVILHHLSVGYGGSGGWPIKEIDFNPIDDLTIILLTLFNALNQSYFMAAFFLLAGYFTPRSFDRKGDLNYLKDRIIRLGFPLVIYVIFFSPLVEFIVINFALTKLGNSEVLLVDIITYRIENLVIGVDHLWFLQALLLFAIGYAIYKGFTNQDGSKENISPFFDSFPSDKVILLSIGVLALITFSIRTIFLIGETFIFNFQFAHFTHYLFSFWVGILAKNGRWFENLPTSQAKRWLGVAILTIIVLPLMLVALVNFNDPSFDAFMGGLTLESFIYSIWESFALLAFSISLLYIFQTKFNRSTKLLKNMADSAYTAYIIHALVIIIIMIALIPITLPAIMKFLIATLIGIPSIFFLSHFIRKIPYFSRVLG